MFYSLPDVINASFEFGAGFAVLHHCFKLYEHKQARGVSIQAVIFFTAWGMWNLFYYPHLGQFWSFSGGIFVTLVNVAYLAMLTHYAKHSVTVQPANVAMLKPIDMASIYREAEGRN